MSGRKVIELFYDVVSPYSRFAFEILCRYRSHWDIELRLRPVLLGALLQLADNPRPAANPRKAAYMETDWYRYGQYLGITHRQPANIELVLTKGTLQPQRYITAVDLTHPQYTEQLSRELWRRLYEEDVDVTEPGSLKEASVRAGLNQAVIDDALTRMAGQEVKDKLRAVTQEALDLGSFGAPFIVTHMGGTTETFFGADRFHMLAAALGETWKGPMPDQDSRL